MVLTGALPQQLGLGHGQGIVLLVEVENFVDDLCFVRQQLEFAGLFGLAVHRDALDALGSIARGGGAAQPSQFFNQAGKVADAAADAVQTVDHNGLEFPFLGRSHHLFEIRAVQVAAGKALVLKDNGMFRGGIAVVSADIVAAEVDLISDTFALAGIAGFAGMS